MRLGIIAEGKADIAVIKAVLKALKGIDGSDVVQLLLHMQPYHDKSPE